MNLSEASIVDGALYTLIFLSVVTWSIIILKTGEIILNRLRNKKVAHVFLAHGAVTAGLALKVDPKQLSSSQAGRIYLIGDLTHKRVQKQYVNGLSSLDVWHNLIERGLLQQLQKEKSGMDSGLGWLATIGSISPFIGLFGTVWGIIHALKNITLNGNTRLEVVAGPIGEVLIATAMGIGVAIPAVIAFNVFLRQNRQLGAELEHYASDFLRNCIELDMINHALEHKHGDTVTQ